MIRPRTFVFCLLLAFPLAATAQFELSSINLPNATEAFETGYDLDGDGRNDLLVVFQRRILVFFQTDAGSFPTAPDLEIGAGTPIPETYAAISLGKVSGGKGMDLLLLGPDGVDYIPLARLRGPQ